MTTPTPSPSLSTPPAPSPAPLRLGVAGLGTVGAGLLRLLQREGDLLAARTGRGFEVVAVSARDRSRDRGVPLTGLAWEEDPVALAHRPDVDVVVELMGGAEGPARALVEAALRAGKAVVTANKALLALHGTELAALSARHNAPLLYEAAVAGGIPAINLLRSGLAGDRVTRVGGILNGTCNYILTEMDRSGRPFDEVLKEAQAKGYAEADPTTDIGGWDAAHKLDILASLAFRPLTFESLQVRGIEAITPQDLRFARALGYRIRLLGMAQEVPARSPQAGHPEATEETRIVAWVGPCLVPSSSRLAHVNGVFNAVVAEGAACGPLVISGAGAGEGPTASAVAGDLVALARGAALPVWGVNPPPAPVAGGSVEELESAFYLRLLVRDQPGVIAAVGKALACEGISVHLVSQHALEASEASETTDQAGTDIPQTWMTVVTHPAPGHAMARATTGLEALDCILQAPLVLKIEPLA
ncbi:homoserine dehydrogenase [Oecophyllibacter saccharovorans]|uniref:Homoserine dehydrogenase n=1 Tax=Oecophyllibacter saccharovorans TaxID=2558360 RepID=A0A506UKI1_9PROT|nr:homoserine dehydrogenase [Oecophyllibacter saccharovorans]TPW33864.1 homoserine dehydrogenase [Oecophyllibacter saccharovorans]